MSRTSAWPPSPIAPACSTSCTASSTVMKNRVTSGCVTVKGPPSSICFWNALSTEPRLPSTLPNRTEMYRPRARPSTPAVNPSATRFEYPRMLHGSAALSVETLTKHSTPEASAASSTASVPHTLVLNPSTGWASSSGRCLSAAAWNTTSGRRSQNSCFTRSRSRMSSSTRSGESSSARPSIDSCTACSADSSRSSMISSAGPNRTIWRHSSEPIDPPAPVTTTRLPCRYDGGGIQIGLDRVAPHQVALGGFANVDDADAAVEQLAHRREHPDRQAGLGRELRELEDDGAVRAGHGDDDRGGVMLGGGASHVVAVADDGDPTGREAAHVRIVVEQRDRCVATFGIGQHRRDRGTPAAAGAEDDDSLAPAILQAAAQLAVVIHPPPEPHRDHDEHRHGAAGEHGRDRQRSLVHDRGVDREQSGAGDHRGLRDAPRPLRPSRTPSGRDRGRSTNLRPAVRRPRAAPAGSGATRTSPVHRAAASNTVRALPPTLRSRSPPARSVVPVTDAAQLPPRTLSLGPPDPRDWQILEYDGRTRKGKREKPWPRSADHPGNVRAKSPDSS